jgi:hypothetical protein
MDTLFAGAFATTGVVVACGYSMARRIPYKRLQRKGWV